MTFFGTLCCECQTTCLTYLRVFLRAAPIASLGAGVEVFFFFWVTVDPLVGYSCKQRLRVLKNFGTRFVWANEKNYVSRRDTDASFRHSMLPYHPWRRGQDDAVLGAPTTERYTVFAENRLDFAPELS